MKTAAKTSAFALLLSAVVGNVPDKCIVPVGKPIGDQKGEEANISDAVGAIAKPSTRFFGLRACTDKTSGILVYVQFYLKSDESEELEEMPAVGPVLSEDLLDCKRRKLEQTDFMIDTVNIYSSASGIDAIRFNVGTLGETFGTPSEDSTITTLTFTETLQLTSIAGTQSFSGIKSIQFSSLDQDCVRRYS